MKAYHLLEGEEWWFRLWSAAVITVLDNTGLLNIHDAFRGSQTLTARKLSTSERWLTGIEGAFTLGTIVATTGYGAVGRVRAIGGWAKRGFGLADDLGQGARRGASRGVVGTAQSPSRTFVKNVSGPRSADDVVSLARKHGIEIGEDVRVRFMDDDLFGELYKARSGEFIYGAYGKRLTGNYDTMVQWRDLLDDQGRMVITLRRSVLDSDQAIIGTIAHEMHEINSLRSMLSGRGMRFTDWVKAIEPGRVGNLHDEAWGIANELLNRIFGNQ